MQNPAGNRALLGERFQLGHQVVVDFGLNLQSARQIDLPGVRLQFGHLLRTDQAVGLLDPRQGDPGLPPEPAFVDFAPNGTHFGAAIAPAKRGLVLREICHDFILTHYGRN